MLRLLATGFALGVGLAVGEKVAKKHIIPASKKAYKEFKEVWSEFEAEWEGLKADLEAQRNR